MSGINTEIENELQHEREQLQQEHDSISKLYYDLKGDKITKTVRGVLAWLLEFSLWILAASLLACFVYLLMYEVAVKVRLNEEFALNLSLESAAISLVLNLLSLVALSLMALATVLALLVRKVRNKNKLLKRVAKTLESIMHRMRASMERVETRKRAFAGYASTHQRKAGERGTAT